MPAPQPKLGIEILGSLGADTNPKQFRRFLAQAIRLGLDTVQLETTSARDLGPLGTITNGDQYLGREHFFGFHPYAPVELAMPREVGKFFVDAVLLSPGRDNPFAASCRDLVVVPRDQTELPPLPIDQSATTLSSQQASQLAIRADSLHDQLAEFGEFKSAADTFLYHMAIALDKQLG